MRQAPGVALGKEARQQLNQSTTSSSDCQEQTGVGGNRMLENPAIEEAHLWRKRAQGKPRLSQRRLHLESPTGSARTAQGGLSYCLCQMPLQHPVGGLFF